MKLSKIYKDKKKGVHVCYSGSHYGAPADSKVDTDKRAELGPVSTVDGKEALAVKQGDVAEHWPLIGAYTKGGEKEKPAKEAPAPKGDKEEPAPKSAKKPEPKAKGAAAPAPQPAKKKGSKKDAPRKRSDVTWKELSAEQNEAVIERIRAAGGDEALPTLKAAWANWLSDRKLPLFQGFNFGNDEANERVQALGRELMKEFGGGGGGSEPTKASDEATEAKPS